MLFRALLKTLIHKESMQLITASGRRYDIGDGTPPRVVVKLHRKSLEWSLGFDPQLKVGEAYMDGTLTVERGDLRDFLRLLFINMEEGSSNRLLLWLERLNGRLEWFKQFNPISLARLNVARHYDLPDQLFDFFLGPDRQYSCGYFTNPSNSLEQAQADKKRHIASKLLLDRPGLKVLDIGSGWGGLGVFLAREAGCRVKGITLSTEQYKYSRDRAAAAGLGKNCQFELRDYRQEEGPYDRIVSVGMFEHVGKKNYDEFFGQIKHLLADDGVCVLHSVARLHTPGPVNAFIRKHIFPGADVPVLSEAIEPIERAGLLVTDVEILRMHYAETLKHWADRYRSHRAEVVALYGERFYRKWEFYLISCEMGFRYEYMMVFQIQMTKKLRTAPFTRDYMYEWEHAERARTGHAANTA
jgi:cyclopropane-fatty-acyl-phospholipid synthase